MIRTPALIFFALLSTAAYAQDERLVPSYDEKSGFIRDYPGIDLDVQPYVSSWKDSPVRAGFGGLAVQDIFTPGDPQKPARKGAVLAYLKTFAHGVLYGNSKTEPVSLIREQIVFYIMNGVGKLESGGVSTDISAGTGVFIPAGVEYRIANTAGTALEAVIIVEAIPTGFTPAKKPVVKCFRDQVPGFCCWAYTTYGLFGAADGLAEPMGIAIIEIERFGMGSPHYHVPGCEEIWLKLSGDPNPLMLGKKLLRQDIGDAFLPAPNGLMPHAVINDTERPMTWLYVGNRHDMKK
jgi:mannose-6-phosphate isomerase-like protein (cupin superfamily)